MESGGAGIEASHEKLHSRRVLLQHLSKVAHFYTQFRKVRQQSAEHVGLLSRVRLVPDLGSVERKSPDRKEGEAATQEDMEHTVFEAVVIAAVALKQRREEEQIPQRVCAVLALHPLSRALAEALPL